MKGEMCFQRRETGSARMGSRELLFHSPRHDQLSFGLRPYPAIDYIGVGSFIQMIGESKQVVFL
jgi:hypothetical protein